MKDLSAITTQIGQADADHIYVRGRDLTDLMREISFTAMIFLLVGGREPQQREIRLLDAILVSLADHGLTLSAVATRMTYSVTPDAIQGAVAAGLLGVGGMLVGSMEQCGKLLTELATEVDFGTPAPTAVSAAVRAYVARGERLAGLGHSLHRRGDPRVKRLFEVAEECGMRGRYCALLESVAVEATNATHSTLPINAPGAIAALLLELGIPWPAHRGFALISRVPGLIAHALEERERPVTPALRQLFREASE